MEKRWKKAGDLPALALGKALKEDINMPKYIFIILALALSGCLDHSASSNSSSSSNSRTHQAALAVVRQAAVTVFLAVSPPRI